MLDQVLIYHWIYSDDRMAVFAYTLANRDPAKRAPWVKADPDAPAFIPSDDLPF